MEIIQQYIVDEALILVPVLYIIGSFLKQTELIKDKYIPILIWCFGVIFSFMMLGLNIDSFIQGTLLSGVTVFANQIYIQNKKVK